MDAPYETRLGFDEWSKIIKVSIEEARGNDGTDLWNETIITNLLQKLKNTGVQEISFSKEDVIKYNKQMLADRDFISAMFVTGSLASHPVDKTQVDKTQEGGTNDGKQETITGFLDRLTGYRSEINMARIGIDIEQFVTENDLFASYITYDVDDSMGYNENAEHNDSENKVRILRYVINTFATSEKLLACLSNGNLPLMDHVVTVDQINYRLPEITSNMTEVLLSNIMNKDNHRRRVYNALYLYFVNTNISNEFAISELAFGKITEDQGKNQLIQECETIVYEFVLNESRVVGANLYDVFPMFKVTIDDVVYGALLKHIYCMLDKDYVDTLSTYIIECKINYKEFTTLPIYTTLDAYARIFIELDCFYAMTNHGNCDVFQILLPYKSGHYYPHGPTHSLCFIGAHGDVVDSVHWKRITENLIPVVTEKKQKNRIPQVPINHHQRMVVVPDNVLMIRIGIFGEYLTGYTDVISRIRNVGICENEDVLHYLLTEEAHNRGFDIVPPGYPCHNMYFTTDTAEDREKGLLVTGKVFCEIRKLDEIPEGGMYLKQVLEEVSEYAKNAVGKPVLLIISHCMYTNDASMRSHSNQASETALRQIPKNIRISGHEPLDVELTQSLSMEQRGSKQDSNGKPVNELPIASRNPLLSGIMHRTRLRLLKNYGTRVDERGNLIIPLPKVTEEEAEEVAQATGGGRGISLSSSFSIGILGLVTIISAFVQR